MTQYSAELNGAAAGTLCRSCTKSSAFRLIFIPRNTSLHLLVPVCPQPHDAVLPNAYDEQSDHLANPQSLQPKVHARMERECDTERQSKHVVRDYIE